MRSSRPSSRSACSRTGSGMPASSILVRYSPMTSESSSPSSLRIESICLRRKYSRCCCWAQDSGHAAVVAAQLEDLVDHRAVIALELARAPVDRDVVDALVDLDPQVALGIVLGLAEQTARHALEGRAADPAGQADAIGDTR